MALRLPVLREIATALRTQVEDTELTLLLASRRHQIVFVPEAVVEDPKPDGTERFVHQRARWLQGHRRIWKFYGPTILRLFFTGGIGVWWLLGTLLLKPRTLFIPVKVLGLLGLMVFSSHPAARVLTTLIGFSVTLDVCRYLVGLAFVPAGWRLPIIWAMARVPAFAAMWVRSFALSLTSREVWLRARD